MPNNVPEGGDREEIPDLDLEAIALLSDPEGGGEVWSNGEDGGEMARRTEVSDAHDRFANTAVRADGVVPIDDGGEVTGDPDGGGEIAMDRLNLLTQVSHLAAQGEDPPPPPPPPPPPQRAVTDDPDGGDEATLHLTPIDDGGEIALQTTPIDDGGEIVSDPDGGGELHLAMPADDGGEIFQGAELSGDPDGGGEIVGDPDGGGEIMGKVESNRLLKEQVRLAQKTLEQYKANGPEAPGDPDGGGEVISDPDGGGEIADDPDGGDEVAATAPASPPGVPVPYPNVADDPDGGHDIDGEFGSGAMPPRPVTMTIDDLQGDPDGGGEVAGDPDGGGEVASRPPLDGIGIDDLTIAEDPDAGGEIVDIPAPVEPIEIPGPEITDLEVSGTFDEAGHTFEPD